GAWAPSGAQVSLWVVYALPKRQNLCQLLRLSWRAFFSRSCRECEERVWGGTPVTKDDRLRAVMLGRARQTRPGGRCYPGCRCNKCRTPTTHPWVRQWRVVSLQPAATYQCGKLQMFIYQVES